MSQPHTYKKPKQDPIEVKIILGFLRGLWWLVMLPFGGKSKGPAKRKAGTIDVADITKRWGDIETTIGLGGATHFGSAVITADKLVDYVLRQQGYAGDTMGERMKSAKETLTERTYQGLWQAHKLRNTLVHEVSGEVMSYQAKEALEQFKQALRELGAIR